jgi:YihY family inner membrane protein
MLIVGWSSTWVFMFVENALNRAWGVPKRRTFWQSRVRSFALLSASAILLLMSAGITGAVSAFRSATDRRLPDLAQDQIMNRLWSWLLVGVGFLIAIGVFSMVYKLMPDRKVLWIEALSGAIASAVLWEIASYLFVKLVPLFDYQRVYGRMGAIVALQTWVYTSSTIMVFGANFSAQLHQPDGDQDTLPAGVGRPTTPDKRVHVFSPR